MTQLRRTNQRKKITPLEHKVCVEYIECGVKIEAYRRVYDTTGKSPEAIAAAAHKVFSRQIVKDHIDELMSEYDGRHAVTVERCVQEYAKIAFTDLPGIIDMQNGLIDIKDFADLTDDQRAAIKEVDIKAYDMGRGDKKVNVVQIKYKLHDKQAALDSLMKHTGGFRKDNEQQAGIAFGGLIPVVVEPGSDLDTVASKIAGAWISVL